MWKCPQCETVNKEDKCVICGESNPYFPRVDLNTSQVGSKLRSTMRGKETMPRGSVITGGNRGAAFSGGMTGNTTQAVNNASGFQNGQAYNASHGQAQRTYNVSADNSEQAYGTPDTIGYQVYDTSHVVQNRQPYNISSASQSQFPNNTSTVPRTQQTYNSTVAASQPSHDVPVTPGWESEKATSMPSNVSAKEWSGSDIKDDDATAVLKKRKKSKKWAVISVVAVIVVLAGGFFGFMEYQYGKGLDAFKHKKFDEAKSTFSGISFYRDSKQMIDECGYEEACKMLEDGKGAEAKELFKQLGAYKDSDLKLRECDYVLAMEHFESENLIEAYNYLEPLVETQYEDSEEQMKDLVSALYESGVEKYKNEEYEASKECFEKYEDGSKLVGLTVDFNYKSYQKLNEACLTTLKDVTELYDLMYFENTKEILLSDKYIRSFLMGKWLAEDNNSIEFVEENGGVKNVCTLPFEPGEKYKLSNGVQYHGNDNNWIRGLKYRIIHENQIEVYCYKNEKTYVMYRQ